MIVPLYYSAKRPVVQRDGMQIMVDDERLPLDQAQLEEALSDRHAFIGAAESQVDRVLLASARVVYDLEAERAQAGLDELGGLGQRVEDVGRHHEHSLGYSRQ